MRWFFFLLVVGPWTAWAQDAALLVSCGDCSAFQGIEVHVDGQPVNVGSVQPAVRWELSSGEHEVRVFKWKSPFSRDELASAVLSFPQATELRVKATPGKLTVYGKGRFEPVVAPAPGPSNEAVRTARELLGEAEEYLREAAEQNEEEDSRCQPKVAAKLELLGEHLRELRAELDLELLKKTARKAADAQRLIERDCPGRVARPLGKKVARALGRLEKASDQLRP